MRSVWIVCRGKIYLNGGKMGKYNSVYFNSERYYDPTAGAALLSIIRNERKTNYVKPKSTTQKSTDEIDQFAELFCRKYEKEHGYRANGKPRRLAQPSKVKPQIKLYEYCMQHCDDKDFTIENTALRFGFGSLKKVEQCFTQRGDIWKIITSWNQYKAERRTDD